MAIYKSDIADVELNSGSILRSYVGNLIGEADALGNRFGVRCFRDGQPESIAGSTIKGYFIRADGGTIAITSGVVDGNEAYITLPDTCYAVEGAFSLAIKLVGSGITGTVRIVDGAVVRTMTNAAVDPGTIIPNIEALIAAIDEAVESIPLEYGELSRTVTKLAEGVAEPEYYPTTISTTRTSGYMDLSGTTHTNDTYQYTNKISVNPGDVIKLVGGNYSYRFVTAFDGSSALSAKGAENVTSYTVPDGVDGVVLSLYTEDASASVVLNRAGYKNSLQDDMDLILIKETSENIFSGSFTDHEQIATSDGTFAPGDGYARTGYIKVNAGTVHIGAQTSSDMPTIFVHAAFYDNSKAFLSGITYTGYTVNTADDLKYQTLTAPADGYVAFDVYRGNRTLPYYVSQVQTPTGYVENAEDKTYINPALVKGGDTAIVESMTYGVNPKRKKKSNFASGETITVESNSIMKNHVISFFAKITSFSEIAVGHGQAEYGEYVRIDNSNIYYTQNGTRIGDPIPHGLTISEYIAVTIKIAHTGVTTVYINTLGGIKTHNGGTWLGRKDAVFAKNTGSTLTGAVLTWSCDDYKKALWAFGDSYFSVNASDRWTYYPVVSWGFDNMLMNAYPGEASASAYNDLVNALKHGTPKYLLWCLGMNDHDDSSAVNATWLEKVQAIETICAQKGITLILATIPQVTNTSYNNTYKNAWVAGSGHRYVDFAEAVNGVTGWLSTDGVHPTAIGARLLAMAAIRDCPEILQSK